MERSKVLVTGGAGFIGSHVVEALLGEGFSVRVLDDLSTGRRENVPQEVDFRTGDLLDAAAVRSALEGVEAVIHLAARVSVRNSLDHFWEDARTNVMGTLNLLRHAPRSGVRRFLYASSMAVYADSPQPSPLPESHPQEPISPYGIAKLASEKYALLVSRTYEMSCLCLRYFNVYGVRQALTPYVGVITIFIERLLGGAAPVIFGDGEQVRDFVHVGDVVRATVLALKSDASGEILNVGSGIGTSVNRVAQLLIQKIRPGIRPVYGPPHPGEIRNSVADITKIRRLLGYRPEGRLTERIDEVIEWKRRGRTNSGGQDQTRAGSD